MAKYLFVYHGGKHPENDAEMARVLDAWGQWMGSMGAAVIDGGYGLFEASDLNDAIAKARACPVLESGGTVELAEALDM